MCTPPAPSPFVGARVLLLLLDGDDLRRNRLPLVRALQCSGAEVTVMMDTRRFHGDGLREIRVIPWTVERGSLNPLTELRSLAETIAAYRRYRPVLVHHFALKPAVYGGIAARMTRGLASVSTITGLGAAFTSSAWYAPLLQRLIVTLLRFAGRHARARTMSHNPDDLHLLIRAGAADPRSSRVVRGSGVDLEAFAPGPEPAGPPIVLYAGRMLQEKGVGDFHTAAGQLRASGVCARFVLVGEPDPAHHSSIDEDTLRAWSAGGDIEWWGARGDMSAVIRSATVVCLPSCYGEGVPKVLLEAAACGRPMIATDVPGCREIVRPGETGILVPPRDPTALAGAVATLLRDVGLRRTLGANARRIACTEFSVDRVVRETFAVYEELLGARREGAGPE